MYVYVCVSCSVEARPTDAQGGWANASVTTGLAGKWWTASELRQLAAVSFAANGTDGTVSIVANASAQRLSMRIEGLSESRNNVCVPYIYII
mmetsp:Transcript_21878/g.59906  ORF Transcript_21878/g.59906 Transcript_21878/m.59906 type:complete len:92 (+) Transcript_21878:92-367(+)